MDHISVINTFDEEQYGDHSYILFLTRLLIENHMLQCSYAGEPLHFDTPLFRELLARCQSIGRQLYFQPPSVLDPSTEDGQNVRQLEERFAHGSLDANALIGE